MDECTSKISRKAQIKMWCWTRVVVGPVILSLLVKGVVLVSPRQTAQDRRWSVAYQRNLDRVLLKLDQEVLQAPCPCDTHSLPAESRKLIFWPPIFPRARALSSDSELAFFFIKEQLIASVNCIYCIKCLFLLLSCVYAIFKLSSYSQMLSQMLCIQKNLFRFSDNAEKVMQLKCTVNLPCE